MIKYLAIALLTFSATGKAQTILLEEEFTSGIPATWTLFNEDGLTPDESVSEFTNAWIGSIIGEDTVAASTSYYDTVGSANDYLITPKVSLGNFSKIVWSARSLDASYPDGYQVLISTTDSLPVSFTDTLMTISAETPYFTKRGVELDVSGYANQDVYIAFQNNTTDGYVLLLDDVKILGAETATINTIQSNESLVIYPNPARDFITIDGTKEIEHVIIYSTSGQILLQDNTNQIDISTLANGLYIIQIETVGGIVSTQQFSKL